MSAWASPMVITGGLFAGGAATIALSRAPIWRRMPAEEFVGDFEQTSATRTGCNPPQTRARPTANDPGPEPASASVPLGPTRDYIDTSANRW